MVDFSALRLGSCKGAIDGIKDHVRINWVAGVDNSNAHEGRSP